MNKIWKVRGEYVTPHNRCGAQPVYFLIWRQKTGHTSWCTITRERLMVMCKILYKPLSFSLLHQAISLSKNFSPQTFLFLFLFCLSAHKLDMHQAQLSASNKPFNVSTLADYGGEIHCYFKPQAPWYKNTFMNDLIRMEENWVSRPRLGCFWSQISLPDHWSKMNSLPKLPTIHNGRGQAVQQSPVYKRRK